jgi:hypothetical protein
MADRKISDLTDNPSPGANTGIVPIIEESVVNGTTTYSQYRAYVKNIVQSGVNAAATTQVDGGSY